MNITKFAYLSHASNLAYIPQDYKENGIIVLSDEGQLYAHGTVIGIGNTAYQGLVTQINNLSDGSINYVVGGEISPIDENFLKEKGIITLE